MKRQRKSARNHQFTVQRLEKRQLLAGDIGPIDQLFMPQVDFGPQPPTAMHQPAARADGQRSLGLPLSNDVAPGEFRTLDGTGNNLDHPELGSTDTQLNRAVPADYADEISEAAGADRPSAREISNVLSSQTTTETNDRLLTDITWLFGQFIDHDIDLTENADPSESLDIAVPEGDIFFDPTGSREAVISLNRSNYDTDTGTSTDNPRQQINEITAFIDGSVIYGSDEVRAAELRTFESGLLKTSEGDLLPFNEAGLDNAGGTGDSLFLAGDIRANENAALTAMHTLWVRDHNQWAEKLAADDPTLTDEQLYQGAKAIVTAELQAITFNEFLPALLGEDAINDYAGYQASVDPSINNVFSTSAYRFGHSMLPTELLRLNSDGTTADEGNLSLQNAFFSPDEISANGIESILLGATEQLANEVDTQVVDDIRNFLFGPPGSGGFDLVSLNIQRGRDHGLGDYNDVRESFGLERVTEFSEITSDTELAAKLEQLYGDVDSIDAWVGGLAEDHVEGSSLGELNHTVIADQFERLRDGDRFWYQNVFSGQELREIESTTLADIIERNTDIEGLRENLFFDASAQPEQPVDNSGGNDHDRQDRHRDRVRDPRPVVHNGSRGDGERGDRNDQRNRTPRRAAHQLASRVQRTAVGNDSDRTSPLDRQNAIRDQAFGGLAGDPLNNDLPLPTESGQQRDAGQSRGNRSGRRGV